MLLVFTCLSREIGVFVDRATFSMWRVCRRKGKQAAQQTVSAKNPTSCCSFCCILTFWHPHFSTMRHGSNIWTVTKVDFLEFFGGFCTILSSVEENDRRTQGNWLKESLYVKACFVMGSVTSALTRTRNALVKVGSQPENHDSERSRSAPESDRPRKRSKGFNLPGQTGRQSSRQSLSEVLSRQDSDGAKQSSRKKPAEAQQSGEFMSWETNASSCLWFNGIYFTLFSNRDLPRRNKKVFMYSTWSSSLSINMNGVHN